jgi:YHS domain-containing protein
MSKPNASSVWAAFRQHLLLPHLRCNYCKCCGGAAPVVREVSRVKPAGGSSCCGGSHAAPQSMQHDPQGAHKDPVCGMTVNENSQHQFVHAGQTYYFCCDSCKQKFSKNPQTYLNPEQAPAAKPVAKDAIYICPMDRKLSKSVLVSALSAAWHWNRKKPLSRKITANFSI